MDALKVCLEYVSLFEKTQMGKKLEEDSYLLQRNTRTRDNSKRTFSIKNPTYKFQEQ